MEFRSRSRLSNHVFLLSRPIRALFRGRGGGPAVRLATPSAFAFAAGRAPSPRPRAATHSHRRGPSVAGFPSPGSPCRFTRIPDPEGRRVGWHESEAVVVKGRGGQGIDDEGELGAQRPLGGCHAAVAAPRECPALAPSSAGRAPGSFAWRRRAQCMMRIWKLVHVGSKYPEQA